MSPSFPVAFLDSIITSSTAFQEEGEEEQEEDGEANEEKEEESNSNDDAPEKEVRVPSSVHLQYPRTYLGRE